MKKITIILVFITGLFLNNITAQENVPKDVLLNSLNSVNKLKLSNLKTKELSDYNETYVDKVYDILDSNKSEKDKKAALKVLKNDTKRDLNDLLGKKNYTKYQKLMEKELKALIKRNKLLKYLV
jgi:hypothetical protein